MRGGSEGEELCFTLMRERGRKWVCIVERQRVCGLMMQNDDETCAVYQVCIFDAGK